MTIWQGKSLTKAQEALEKDRASVSKAVQDAQAEINNGNKAVQYVGNIVNQIGALTDETKPNGKRDDRLKALIAKDVEGSGIFRITEPSPSPAPAASSTSTPR